MVPNCLGSLKSRAPPGKAFLVYLVRFPFSSWKPISIPFSNSPFLATEMMMGESNVGQVKLSRLFVEVSDKGPLWTDLHSSMHSHNVISDTNQKVWDLRR